MEQDGEEEYDTRRESKEMEVQAQVSIRKWWAHRSEVPHQRSRYHHHLRAALKIV